MLGYIILIVIGILIVVASFLIPDKATGIIDEKKQTERIDELIEAEFNKSRESLSNEIDETINDRVDKAERSLERISNDKIMAVNEYAETVLNDIVKNHEETVFMYSMLNDKHEELKSTLTTVEESAKMTREALDAMNRAKDTADKVRLEQEQMLTQAKSEHEELLNEVKKHKEELEQKSEELKNVEANIEASREERIIAKKEAQKTKERKINKTTANAMPELSFIKNSSKDKIAALYKEGKSDIAIAKELGIGVGEVKLVTKFLQTVNM